MTRIARKTWAAVVAVLFASHARGQTPTAHSREVRGTITIARSTPAVGAVVIVRPEDARAPLRLGTTGASGRFAFDGLEDGIYRAEARREAFVPIDETGIAVNAPCNAEVEVTLAGGARVRRPDHNRI